MKQTTQTMTRVGVTVTFLRMTEQPQEPAPAFPAGTMLLRLSRPSVGFYRYLYDTVGARHVWWLRRTTPDEQLASLLADPGIAIHVLYQGGEPAGFFELDARNGSTVNIAYFGLMPHAIGGRVGFAFLRAAVDAAWTYRPRLLTVNTCTADHPRALPTYLRAGFRVVRTVREIWDVPDRLGLRIPDHLVA